MGANNMRMHPVLLSIRPRDYAATADRTFRGMAMLTHRLFLALALLLCTSAAALAAKDKRVALVIGNGKYAALPHLPNAEGDARLMEKALTAVGFKTFAVIDGDRQKMVRTMKSFTEALTPETNVVIYYAGHGIQFADENYLIPTDSQLTSSSDLPLEAFSLKMVTEQIERARPRIAVFIVDACRNNPLETNRSAGAAANDGATRGLARATGPLGTFIAFATAPGKVATDGTKGNSPFTKALAELIVAPGLPIEQVFKRVRERVVEETGGEQVPWDNSSLTKDFFFTEALPEIPKFSAAATQDAQAWQAAADEDNTSGYKSYLTAFPQGLFADIAQMRVETIEEASKPKQEEQEVAALPVDRSINAAEDLTMWNGIQANGTAEQYRIYLEKFPEGVFAKLARLRLEDARKGSDSAVPAISGRVTANYEEFSENPLYPEITDCDREAGHVQEIADPAVGVYFKQIKPDTAVPACMAALKQYPDSFRILMNYGRAIDAAGRHDEAREIYRTGATAGFPIAFRSLGDVYRDGRGIEKNLTEARYWYVLGAAKKNVFAEFNLALIYENGLGVSADPQKAAYWLWRAAKQGFAPAMEKLSAYYLEGKAVPKDVAQAEILLTGAAEMGHIYAELQLGNHYIDGSALKQNPAAGAHWIQKAARQGYNEAQFRLATLYLDGVGLKKDPAQALNWFTLAKANGVERANEFVASLGGKLGGKAAKKAEKFASSFQPTAVK